jgi:hypothetical protein
VPVRILKGKNRKEERKKGIIGEIEEAEETGRKTGRRRKEERK